VEIDLKTNGRTNPANVEAKACIPAEPEKKSITIPIPKERISVNAAGVSNGKSKMNII